MFWVRLRLNRPVMRLAALLCLGLLAACGRPLTDGERALLNDTHGDAVDARKVRIRKGNFLDRYKLSFPVRPREACQELIWPAPPPDVEILEGSPGAMVLFNHIFLSDSFQLEDFAPDYPKRFSLPAIMVMAHELTHVWQWQNRALTGYHPLKAAAEHQTSDDPYLFDLETEADFLSLGYEQQGAAMEEFICCQALAPDAPRTDRLRRMLGVYFPVKRLERLTQADVLLPWDGVQIAGICD